MVQPTWIELIENLIQMIFLYLQEYPILLDDNLISFGFNQQKFLLKVCCVDP
jgi:hypothetical protein